MKLYFPHFPRLNPASLAALGGKLVLFSFIIGLFIFNVYMHTNELPAYAIAFQAMLYAPYSVQSHQNLAEYFWQQGYIEAGRKELLIAESLSTIKNQHTVLGITNERKTWEEEPVRLQTDYAFWQQIAREKPTYRDAFIKLSATAYQLGKFDEATDYLTRAKSLDPNNPIVGKLQELLRARPSR